MSYLLQASTLGMVPPRYAWITYGWFHEAFWKQQPGNGSTDPGFVQCSRQQRMSIVNEMIRITKNPRYDEHDEGNSIIGNLVRRKKYTS